MKTKLFDYVERDNFVYNLSGLTKLLCFLFLTFASMYAYDIRTIVVMMAFSFVMLKISEIRLSQIRLMIIYVAIFLALNFILTYIFNPQYGTEVYGTSHILFEGVGNYNITEEQVLYQITKTLKYASVVPLGILFVLTTNPSEFASALNGIHISYKAALAVSLTLRYFPDLVREYHDIAIAQQGRGVDLSGKEKLIKRAKNMMNIFVPLIFSTMSRIDIITNAMDLRSFGKHKKRTWYTKTPLRAVDYICIIFSVVVFAAVILFSQLHNHGRFWNPFVYGM
ncbi:MAG: energy-coupling factor transporter transmembrane protein EcfT [Lachnospiraceae bacterium]|nr:energy-coupling factor transporter transmembrane protein EcfT [Lachnospiraceae bacterium]